MLHRLCVSGSDRAAEKWKGRHAIPGAEELALQHLYRAMAWLGEIVENQWRDGRVKQTILHSLGRLDELNGTGALDRFLTSATRFSRNLAVLNAHERGESVTTRTSIIGPQMIFERLWRELGIDKVIAAAARGRSFGVSLERAIYLTVVQRLCISGSDRAAEKWKERHAIPGADETRSTPPAPGTRRLTSPRASVPPMLHR